MTETEIRALEAPSRQMLRFHDLTRREDLIANQILDASFRLGQLVAHITPQRMRDMTGIDVREINRWDSRPSPKRPGILQRLMLVGILVIHPEADTYQFLPDARHWQVSRLSIAESAYQDVLRAILAPAESLGGALAEVQAEDVARRIAASFRSVASGKMPPLPSVANDHLPPERGKMPPAPISPDVPDVQPELHNRVPTGCNRLAVASGQPETAAISEAEIDDYLQRIDRLCGAGEIAKRRGYWAQSIRGNPAAFRTAYAYCRDIRDSRALVNGQPVRNFGRLLNKAYQNACAGIVFGARKPLVTT